MRGRLGTDPELEKLARKCRSEGWDVAITRSNHIEWVKPNGEKIRTGLTMSQGSIRSAVRKLRRELAQG